MPITVDMDRDYMRDVQRVRTRVDGYTVDMVVDPTWDVQVAYEQVCQFHIRHHCERIEQALRAQIEDAMRRYEPRENNWTDITHGADLVRGWVEDKRAQKCEGPVLKLQGWAHKVIQHEGFTAMVLDHADMIRNEGEVMEHCLAKSYIVRMMEGSYIAYHITPPKDSKLPASGFTLGYKVVDGKYMYDQLKGKKNSTHYCNDTSLIAMVDNVHKTIGAESRQFLAFTNPCARNWIRTATEVAQRRGEYMYDTGVAES